MFRFHPLSSSRSGRSALRACGPLLALAVLAFLPAQAVTLYVAPPPTGNDLTGDGSQGSPFATIQHAYGQAADGDTILVAEGTYNECLLLTGVYDLPPSQRSIHVIAEAFDAGDPNTRALTVINGTGLCAPGFSTVNIGGFDSSIEGFTITGGASSGLWSIGGVTITNNVIEGNTSMSGGGLYIYPDNCFYGDVQVTISNNLIRDNSVTFDGNPLSGLGGGMLVGLYPEAYAYPGDPFDGGCRGGSGTIVIQGNTVESNDTEYDGGGIYASTYAYELGLGEARITITQNIIRENTAGTAGTVAYGGGVLGVVLGYGTERIEILNNSVLGNTAYGYYGYGGGVWAGTYSAYEADHHVTVHNNTISGNTAAVGGGMEVLHRTADMYPGQTVSVAVTDNRITGNTATTPDAYGGGGGLSVGMFSQRTTAANMDLVISGNRISNNVADLDGGGVEMRVRARADDNQAPIDALRAPSHATVDFSNNLVALNEAQNTYEDGVGGGALIYLESHGGEPLNPDEPSRAIVNMERNTFADNVSQEGAGGIEVEFYTVEASLVSGVAEVNLDSEIVSDNSGFGLGGPYDQIGVFSDGNDGINTFEITVDVSYSDFFANADANYEDTWVYDRTGQQGNISADPLLETLNSTYVPEPCSPTLDAANPAFDYSLEPAPNGGRANMGHTGGTAAARASLADPSGDNAIDGIDVLHIAVAFGSSFPNPRWDAAADLDGSGIVDGDDLALVAAGYGQTCP